MLYLEPAQLATALTKDFNVELKIGEVTGLKGYSVTLTYDPANLHLKEVKEGSFFSVKGKIFFYHKIDDKKGTVLIDLPSWVATLRSLKKGPWRILVLPVLRQVKPI